MIESFNPLTSWARTRWQWAAAIVALVLLAGVVGYWIGASRSPLTIHSCMARSTPLKVGATCSDGITYNIPVDNAEWTDARGAWHDNGRPDCLPPSSAPIGPIKFASVDVTLNGMGWFVVVWTSCQR